MALAAEPGLPAFCFSGGLDLKSSDEVRPPNHTHVHMHAHTLCRLSTPRPLPGVVGHHRLPSGGAVSQRAQQGLVTRALGLFGRGGPSVW